MYPEIEQIPKSVNVLAVDDSSKFLELLKANLEVRAGTAIEMDLLTEPEDALEILDQNEYDTIILDYRMPKIDGIELLEKIRENFSSIPAIIETNSYRPEIEREAYSKGATAVMRKSSDDDHYMGLIKAILQETMHYRACKDEE